MYLSIAVNTDRGEPIGQTFFSEDRQPQTKHENVQWFIIFVFQMNSSAKSNKEDEDRDQDFTNYNLRIFNIKGKNKRWLSKAKLKSS